MQEETKIYKIRHSLAHLLAIEAKKFDKSVKLAIGPVIDNGFYYDFEFSNAPTDKDLKDFEKGIRKSISADLGFDFEEVTSDKAREIFKDEPYKIELIEEILGRGEKLSIYKTGDFVDLCAGPHVENTKEINPDAFSLTKIAGAYWRGDEKNIQLTRIYGVAFETKEELENYERAMVEAEKRDHRKLGKEMDIFEFDEDVGPGLPLWLPNGTVLAEELEKLGRQLEFKYEYEQVRTPHIAKEKMYLTSGHLPFYEDSMFPPMEYEGGKYYLKAMNCPHHHKIYASRPKSYRDLPIRLAEYGTCYRHEKSGELFGLMRVRSMQMNDAHIYCTEEQFFDEFKKVIEMYLYYFKVFDIKEYKMRLSKHSKDKLGKKYINEPELWIKTEDMVRKCLEDLKVPFFEADDEAAFYGPKIDVQIFSAIGKEYTLATNQVDFAVPARFGLTYTDKDGKEKTPLCIHRAPLSTHERLIGFLIEHYALNFPTWLAPTQIFVVPVKEDHYEKAKALVSALRDQGIRAKIDLSNDNFGKKIRKAKDAHTPFIAILGDKELEVNKFTLESRDDGNLGQVTSEEILTLLKEKISNRRD